MMINRRVLLPTVTIFIVSLFSCSNENEFKDPRDGKIYKTVKIGNQVWMAENLNYEDGKDSYCYDDIKTNCDKYGKLYSMKAVEKAIPPGWHLPSREEWQILLDSIGNNEKDIYKNIIFGGKSGFNVIFAGGRYDDFTDLDEEAHFWTSNQKELIFRFRNYGWSADVVHVYKKKRYVIIGSSDVKSALSVRCIKN